MEKLTIKPWQVMQAHENGAKVECTNKNDDYPWIEPNGVIWNFPEVEYRIANLTADGMRLDELVEKFQYELPVLCDSGNYITVDTTEFIKEMCETPSKIAKVKVKRYKKLRPWTMVEFEKHRDEWFVSKSGSKQKVIHFNDNTLIPAWYEASITYKEFMESFSREDGSLCGVIE